MEFEFKNSIKREETNSSEQDNQIKSQIGDYIENGENAEAPMKKRRKKRRTKDEIEGRNFICELCSKAYLSYPALTNHRKAKHSDNNGGRFSNKKLARGRPKKNSNSRFMDEYEEKLRNFFNSKENRINDDKQIRKISIEINESLPNLINTAFYDIYEKNNNNCFNKKIDNWKNHTLLKMLAITEETETDNNSSTKNKTIDEALANFIKSSIYKTNENYLILMMKLVCILHETINKYNSNSNFCQTQSSELIPDYSNEFFNFMNDSNFFGMDEEDLKIEMVEWILYLCLWLNSNRYSSTKINLTINKNI